VLNNVGFNWKDDILPHGIAGAGVTFQTGLPKPIYRQEH
jgi:hypothetical protein